MSMIFERYQRLISDHAMAPPEFQPTSYWQPYTKQIADLMRDLDVSRIRSGDYPVLGTFGFYDQVYHQYGGTLRRKVMKFVQEKIIRDRTILPYSLGLSSLRQSACDYCALAGEVSGAQPLKNFSVSDYGAPADIFTVDGRKYTYQSLLYYLRYCFLQSHVKLSGNEVIVELGSGSGYQIEVLKQLHPGLTVLCFDLAGPLVLCEHYLGQALGADQIVSSDETLNWASMAPLRAGKVHFFGSWRIPMVSGMPHDVFWNAASFGEMEPQVVENYLSFVKGSTTWAYLNQASGGKEMTGTNAVKHQTKWSDYMKFLDGYALVDQRVPRSPIGLAHGGCYLEGVWRKIDSEKL